MLRKKSKAIITTKVKKAATNTVQESLVESDIFSYASEIPTGTANNVIHVYNRTTLATPEPNTRPPSNVGKIESCKI